MTTDNSDPRPTGAETPNDSSSPDVPMVPMGTDAFPASPEPARPKLVFQHSNHVATAYQVRNLLSTAPHLFDHNGPVRLVTDKDGARIEPLTRDLVAIEAAKLADIERAVRSQNDGPSSYPASLPLEACGKYLSLTGEFRLPLLTGIAYAPIVHGDGSFITKGGYDAATGLWQANIPPLHVPDVPTSAEAKAALARLRHRFRTFPFGDAETVICPDLGIPVVRQDVAPGLDESSYLVGLLTAIVRPSLQLAPGLIIRAAFQSGSGSGKGLLAKAACIVATGMTPHAITAGHEPAETDKRLISALKAVTPFIFLDNVNSTMLRSDTLASAITEPKAQLRPLGSSDTTPVMGRSFIILTGNGLDLSEDLVSRFIGVELDAKTDDPETRRMPPGFIEGVMRDRASLLADGLTIIRYGIQNPYPGLPLRNFDDWAQRCRDGLLALGATDPVLRVAQAKANDPMREHHTAIMNAWQAEHGSDPVAVKNLKKPVADLIAPNANRQALAAKVRGLVGMRIGKKKLAVAQQATGNSPTFYMLVIEPG